MQSRPNGFFLYPVARLVDRVARKGELQKWLRCQLEADPPPRRMKKRPVYKYPELLGKLVLGEPGSDEFWNEFPVNHDWSPPYNIDEQLLIDTAVRMEYPHLVKVAGVCKEIINGVDQGLDWGKYEHTASANNPSVTSAEWEPSMVILPLEEIDGRQLRLIPG